MADFELLRETVKAILSEGFDIRKLESIGDLAEIYYYMHELRASLLGEGSARFVYKISPRFVLKVANFNSPGKGPAQNRAEVDAFTNPETRRFLNRIYKFDDDYDWILAELVKPIKTFSEFEKIMGIDFETFRSVLYGIRNYHKSFGIRDENDRDYVVSNLIKKYYKHGLEPDFVEEMIKLIGKMGIMTGDIAKLEHWGKTTDGRGVLYDYGFTKEVMLKHYAPA